tara:strand:+ start:8584 stop:9300 length:717 start_codon:yes stop_codon:yes gene_type:complete
MHIAFLVAEVVDNPLTKYQGMDNRMNVVSLRLPAVGKKKVDTLIEYRSYKEINLRAGDCVQIMDASIRHDYKTREWWLMGGNLERREAPCPPYNYCIFSGRVIKDLDVSDPRQFTSTESGFLIAKTTLSITAGGGESDLIPITAINSSDAKYKPAQLLADMAARKGMGLTVRGTLVTDSWTDKESGEIRYKTEIMLKGFTMAPKAKAQEIKPRAEVPVGAEPKSLWKPLDSEDDNDPF